MTPQALCALRARERRDGPETPYAYLPVQGWQASARQPGFRIRRRYENRAVRSRSELVTTLTLLNAIAALARMGLRSSPNAG